MGLTGVALPSSGAAFSSARLERVFGACFAKSMNTRLSGGATEPLYQPATEPGGYHTLYYRDDYFASALHEVAHWCIAGAQRRQRMDFGYWYTPDGRSVEQQRAFGAVEYGPQALEWFFSKACGYRFQTSLDNLDLAVSARLDKAVFERKVLNRSLAWQQEGLPGRAEVFFQALCGEFGTTVASGDLHFGLAELA